MLQFSMSLILLDLLTTNYLPPKKVGFLLCKFRNKFKNKNVGNSINNPVTILYFTFF